MRAVIVLALLGTVLSAVAFEDSNVEVLDDLQMVEVMEQGACSTQVAQAKTKCQEELLYYKEMVNSKCGQTHLAKVQARIKRNLAKQKALAEKLGGAQSKLRALQYQEGQIKGSAALAKEKVLKAMIHQYHQKQALMGDEKKVKAELADENSTRSKANRATHAAEKLARKTGNMHAGDKAKQLWSKMVQEKVNMGRQYWLLNKDKKLKKVTDKQIDRLFNLAKAARAKEEKELKKIKDATSKVAKDNSKLADSEKKVAKEEKAASEKEKADFGAQMKKAAKLFKKGMTDVQKKEVILKHFQAQLDEAHAAVKKLAGEGLKQQLSQAQTLLKPVKSSPRL